MPHPFPPPHPHPPAAGAAAIVGLSPAGAITCPACCAELPGAKIERDDTPTMNPRRPMETANQVELADEARGGAEGDSFH